MKNILIILLLVSGVCFAKEHKKTVVAQPVAPGEPLSQSPSADNIQINKIKTEIGYGERWYDPEKKVTCYIFRFEGSSITCIKD